jgi:hypothetical protein
MTNYDVFMLRIWKEEQTNQPTRLTVENTRTGSRVGFTDWETLVAFLEKKTGHNKEDST